MIEQKAKDIGIEELETAIKVFKKLSKNDESLWFISNSANQALYSDITRGLTNYVDRLKRTKESTERRLADRSRYF